MAVTILRYGRILIASVPAGASDRDLQDLQQDVADEVGRSAADGVVIDVSALDVLDSYATRVLQTAAEVAGLRGAEAVIVGIQPEVALAMVQLGLTLGGLGTALDLDDGLDALRRGIGGDGADR